MFSYKKIIFFLCIVMGIQLAFSSGDLCDVNIENFHIPSENQISFTLSGVDISNVPIRFDFQRIFLHPEEKNMVVEPAYRINSNLTIESDGFNLIYYESTVDGKPHNINLLNLLEFPSISQNMISGKYNVNASVVIDGCLHDNNQNISVVLPDKLFCDNSVIEDSCDFVPRSNDLCPGIYGSPYYLGCPSEFVLDPGETEIKFNHVLKDTIVHVHPPQLLTQRSFEYENDVLSCVGGINNKIFKDGVEVADSGLLGIAQIYNPQEGEYECKSGGHLLVQTNLSREGPPLNGFSVFDVDRDGLKYFPQWWQDRFPHIDVSSINLDQCPATFGLKKHDGCPATNQENLQRIPSQSLEDSEISNIIIADDLNRNKLFYDESTSSFTASRGDFIIQDLPEITNLVRVNITSSCVPTQPLSTIIRINPKVRAKLDLLTLVDTSALIEDDFMVVSETQRLDNIESQRDVSQINATQRAAILETLLKTGNCNEFILREDLLTKYSMFSQLHLLNPIDDVKLTSDVMNRSIEIVNQLSIDKIVDPIVTPTQFKTNITLYINNIPQNTTIWQVIPLENIQDFDELFSSIRVGNADEIRIKDKNPIIGWYFGSGGGSGEIGFTIEGTGTGGVTIPTDDSIYFNYGDLIINYREFGCYEGENKLFTFDNISGSTVNFTGKEYSLCIAHRDSEIIDGTFSVRTQQLIGIESEQLTQSITNINLYSNNLDYYYAMRLESSFTSGVYNFSCLGSIDSQGNFGGCMYRPNNRLWVYFGPDLTPPEISLVSGSMGGSSINPRFNVFDEISGINSIRYCVINLEDGSSCAPNIEIDLNGQIGTNNFDFSMSLTCPGIRGCEKLVNISATDVSGLSSSHSELFTMVDEASSCTSECVAVPEPGRHIASCRGINGCEYFEIDGDGGEQVAHLCDYRIRNSWVSLDSISGFSNQEIQCPRGPIRTSRMSSEKIRIDSVGCSNIRVDRRPIILDGESVIMSIIICE